MNRNRSRLLSLFVAFLWISLGSTSPVHSAILDVTHPDYGAVGDGVTHDGPAIQLAIDAAGPGDIVFLPAGTYLLEDLGPGRPDPASNVRTALLWLHSDLTIEGEGKDSVLLVGQHLNNCTPGLQPRTGGFSVLQGDDGGPNNNVTLRNFAIDGNADHNELPMPEPGCNFEPPDPTSPNFNREGRFVTILEGSNILIEDCHFYNSRSYQIVRLGRDQDPSTVQGVRVLNNTFTNHAQDPQQTDHSSVYVNAGGVAGGIVGNYVQGNTFANEPGSRGSVVATALEIHGRFTRVEDNLVRNYRLGANVVASRTDSIGNVFYDNDFRAVNGGFNLWSVPEFQLIDTVIEANWVEEAFVNQGDHLIDWNLVYSPVENLLIKDNVLLSSVTSADPSRKGIGINIQGYAHDVSIIDNVIWRTACEGIRIGAPAALPPGAGFTVDFEADALSGRSWVDGLTIEGNTIRDPGSWGAMDSGCSVGVNVLSTAVPTGYKMRDIQMTSAPGSVNRIRYASTPENHPNGYAGVRLRGPVEDSTFSGIDIPSEGFSGGGFSADFETPGTVEFVDVTIDHHDRNSGADPIVQKIRVCGVSQWKTSGGVVWTKPSNPATCNTFADWILVGGSSP